MLRFIRLRSASRLRLKTTPPQSRSKSTQSAATTFDSIPGPEGYTFQADMGTMGTIPAFDKAYRDFDSPVIKFLGPITQKEEVALFDVNDIRMLYAKEGKYPFGAASFNQASMNYFEQKRKEAGTKYTRGIAAQGELWRETRDIIGPGLMTDAALSYLGLITDAAAAAVDVVDLYKDNLGKWTKAAAYDMFTSVALGDNPKSTDPESTHQLAELVETGDDALSLSVLLSTYPKEMQPPNAYEDMVEKYETIFRVTRSYLESRKHDGEVNLPDCWFKDLKMVQGLDMEEIILLMPAFLAAGIGTTEGVTNWILLNLINNPEKQEKLYEELKSELNGQPFRKSAELPYLKACIRESHRLNPPGPAMTMRTHEKDVVTESGYEIPAGTLMWFCPYQVNRDPRYVEDADKYIPERFFKDAVKKRKESQCPHSKALDHGLSKHPFSMGARGCLGRRAAELEIQSLLVELFSRYRVEADPPNQPYKHKQNTLVIPDPMPKVKLIPR